MSIVISGLRKSFNGLQVIRDLTLEIPEHGIIGLSGPSGCGKTTLLRLLAGLTAPDAGIISGLKPGAVSMVFQEDRLLPWLSAEENIALVVPDHKTAQDWLVKVQLADWAGALPDDLSGGMKRRIALARALAWPSELLLLDEPFTGMDSELKSALYDLIRKTAADRPVILVTHDSDDLRQLADQILLAAGPPLELARHPTPANK